jgi:prepilin-type N-terminal cleavage/methylation domain-containing protein
MSVPTRRQGESGFTLIELTLVTLLFGIIVAGALSFMTSQQEAFSRGTGQLVSLQNLRYAYQLIEIDLSTLGSNVPAGQPSLVYGGDSVVAFSADHTSNRANDASAVYINTDFPSGWVVAPSAKISIPGAGKNWPDTIYKAGPVRSPAEFIMLYFEQDGTTARTDDYLLLRKVNQKDPEVVARHLLKLDDRPFFRYYQEKTFTSAAARLDSIPDSSIPLFHTAVIHGSLADTTSSALTDSVRAIRINFRSTNGRPGVEERLSDVSRIIPLPNAGLGLLRTCGDAPIQTETLNATATLLGGVPSVALSWSPVVDEGAGENDVIRYVIFKRDVPNTGDWGEPFLSIPAGAASYTYTDSAVESGKAYEYAFAAQDCTPTLSSLSSKVGVLVP